jgi:hypothetical protein
VVTVVVTNCGYCGVASCCVFVTYTATIFLVSLVLTSQSISNNVFRHYSVSFKCIMFRYFSFLHIASVVRMQILVETQHFLNILNCFPTFSKIVFRLFDDRTIF